MKNSVENTVNTTVVKPEVNNTATPSPKREEAVLKIAYKVTSVDLDKYTCNLSVSTEKGSKSYRNVKISGLLRYKFASKDAYYTVGKTYESLDNSEDKKANPFQLIRYTDKVGDNCLLLACVDEWKKDTKKVVDVLGNVTEETVYKFHTKKHYWRYRNYVK